jgi:hypothetical protein
MNPLDNDIFSEFWITNPRPEFEMAQAAAMRKAHRAYK